MGLNELVKDLKGVKGKNAGMKAMNFLTTRSGAKLMTGIARTKERVDKKLRAFWDFVGLPSFSDNEKVERAIGRVGQRLREIEHEIEGLDGALGALESRMRDWRKTDSAPAAEKPRKTAAAKPVSKAKTPPKKTVKPFATRPVEQNAPAFKSPLLNLKLKK